ncbi:NUDIX domain-containing protein [Streptomyces sp. NPDC094038]|uniref:NUDIX domain-containing protein n=1 Tax=Streptomyces sp. NPDC094038 TaxID=3366055 RepID=UPI0038050530
MSPALQRPVVCILAVRPHGATGFEVLLQRRTKTKDDTPYNGYLELPQGKVNRNESLMQAAHRELAEETGLTIRRFLVGGEQAFRSVAETSVMATSQPFVCVSDSVQNHIGLCVIVEVSGDLLVTKEASGHRWYSPGELETVIATNGLFPLNVPMVRRFLDTSPETEDAWLS